MIDRLTRLPRAFPTLPKLFRVSCAVALAAFAALSVSCDDLTGLPANLPTLSDSGVVYAINGAPPGAPTSLYFYSGVRLAADADFIFDVAFDLNPAGGITILPQRAVASALAGTQATLHAVGLQKSIEAFDEITSAPRSGYHPDTAIVVNLNETVIAQSQDPNVCGLSITGTSIHAKIVVTAVDVANRSLRIRYTVDPNCGFRSFASGIPKD